MLVDDLARVGKPLSVMTVGISGGCRPDDTRGTYTLLARSTLRSGPASAVTKRQKEGQPPEGVAGPDVIPTAGGGNTGLLEAAVITAFAESRRRRWAHHFGFDPEMAPDAVRG